MTEKIWALKYEADSKFLSGHPRVLGWMRLRDREQEDVDRAECRVWVSDMGWPDLKKMPTVLFGLPTTYVVENKSYGVQRDRILKKNFMSLAQKVAYGVLIGLVRTKTP